MDLITELAKISKFIEHDTQYAKSDLLKFTIYMKVDMEEIESMFENDKGEIVSVKNVIYMLQRDLENMENSQYKRSRLPDWSNGIYIAEIQEKDNG